MSSRRQKIRHGYEFPDHVFEEILTRLPAKHVSRCKFLSKTYYDLIKSPRFINKHFRYHSASTTKSNIIHKSSKPNADDEISHGIAYLPTSHSDADDIYIPFPANIDFSLVGSCNGLLCARFITEQPRPTELVVWNPATREHKILPPAPSFQYKSFISSGFGYDATTDDYKLVMFHCGYWCPPEAVFWSMRTNSWKKVKLWNSVHQPDQQSRATTSIGTFIKGNIYWLISKVVSENLRTIIIAFNVAKSRFNKRIALPDDAPSWKEPGLASAIVDFKGSLAFLTNLMPSSYFEFGIWLLKEDVDHDKNYKWEKQFTIGRFPTQVLPTRISMNGKFLLKEIHYPSDGRNYFWYDPHNEERREISSSDLPFFRVPFWSFTGSLLPLKQATVE